MNARLEELKRRTRDREFAGYRREVALDLSAARLEPLSWARRTSLAFRLVCEAEEPVVLPDEQIVFTRTVKAAIPEMPPPAELVEKAKSEGAAFGPGAFNICADWGMVLGQGLLSRRQAAIETGRRLAKDESATDYLQAVVETLDAVLSLAERYEAAARSAGRADLADLLHQVPAHPPRTFHEALQSQRFLQAALWKTPTGHVTLGRFDQYMWPYLKSDLEAGRLTVSQAEELLAEYFIALNRDSDLYPGIQLGDNGQSLMLGGVTREGQAAVNELTWMVLRVAREVRLIDPKINLRVSGDTDLNLLVEASRLTRCGLGFPQYSNDDVVIPGLVRHGYSLEDARDYTVAACWEFIVPGVGMDIPNINALNFTYAANQAICDGLSAGEGFAGVLERTRAGIRGQVQTYVKHSDGIKYWAPSPLYSACMTGCIEQGRDVQDGGAKYNNFGIHGAGSANAADALAAVKHFVFDQASVSGRELSDAVRDNWAGQESLRLKIINEGPKVGNNDDQADSLLRWLFDSFADACESIPDNGLGRIVRPGTGSAMYYVFLVTGGRDQLEPVVGASADGRHEGDFLSSSLAPSPGVKARGPLSVLQSFSKIDYRRVCNGGPITMELSDTVFRSKESLQKVALLVRTFAQVGCQQLQLNTLNPEILRDAKAHPERHRNLVVRVWGWSGYFCELEEPYQDHIIARQTHGL